MERRPRGTWPLQGLDRGRASSGVVARVDSQHILCGLDGAECDFATPDREFHWVLLIPQESLASYLDPQTVESLRDRRVLRCAPELSVRLFALARRAVEPSVGSIPCGQDSPGTMALRAELMEAASQLVIGESGNRRYSRRRRNYRVWRRAIEATNSVRGPISVSELASEVGASRRTLERAFQETVGVSPYKFSRLHRLNRLYRDLRRANVQQGSVTQLLTDWGFSELGRTAVEYRSLFGESPSMTLAQEPSSSNLTLADALNEGTAPDSADLWIGTARLSERTTETGDAVEP